ncbi:MAG: helix-turn-helix domain-containing protein [Candidatus Sumerlaeia bacterium]|nr:helix-turn-helix domain-containing protein [Candidatus Sumerlaeia bacterium]
MAKATGTSHQEDRYVPVHLHQLRQKLGANPGGPRLLITEPWVGYRLGADRPGRSR